MNHTPFSQRGVHSAMSASAARRRLFSDVTAHVITQAREMVSQIFGRVARRPNRSEASHN
jgi:hypothetical protein